MKYLNDHFREIEKRTGYPEDAIPVLEGVAHRLDTEEEFGKKFEKIRKNYMYGRASLSHYIRKIEKLAGEYGIHP